MSQDNIYEGMLSSFKCSIKGYMFLYLFCELLKCDTSAAYIPILSIAHSSKIFGLHWNASILPWFLLAEELLVEFHRNRESKLEPILNVYIGIVNLRFNEKFSLANTNIASTTSIFIKRYPLHVCVPEATCYGYIQWV